MREGQRYQVIQRIAAGGMAEVFQGESAGIEGFRKKVAIKRVLAKLSANQDFIEMFLDEARLGAFLNHSRCVQVFDIGQGGGAHFIVMEYVDGADLKGILDHLSATGQQMKAAVALLIAQHVAEGLAYAHACKDHQGVPLNIVHRDISPHNVLISRYGEVKLVDFGLAKASSHLTDEDEGIVKGKFGYLAPEVTLGQGADHRVDIFAAGILLWEMLAGRRLFLGESDLETFKLVRAANVPDIRQLRPDVSAEVSSVLARALARDPEQRYPTADALARDLSVLQIRLGEPVCYLDIAGIVQQAADARKRRKQTEKVDESTLMGDVIIDALHAFSSGHPGSRLPAVRAKSRVASGGFEDPSAWGLGDALDDFVPDLVPPPPPGATPLSPGVAAPRPAPPAQAPFATAARPAPPTPPPPAAGGPPPNPAVATPARPAPSNQTPGAPPFAEAAPAPAQQGAWWRRWWNT
jgi:serine/threonine protein kinase